MAYPLSPGPVPEPPVVRLGLVPRRTAPPKGSLPRGKAARRVRSNNHTTTTGTMAIAHLTRLVLNELTAAPARPPARGRRRSAEPGVVYPRRDRKKDKDSKPRT